MSQKNIILDTILSTKIDSIKSQQQDMNITELVLCYTAQNIASNIASNKAMLLPDLYRKFLETLSSSFPRVRKEEFPSTRWFVSRLHEDNLIFDCRHRHIGTLVFHKNCDLVVALSTALGKLRNAEKRAQAPLDEQITNVTSHFHNKLDQQAKKFISEYRSPANYTNMEISTLIQSTDQELLQFINGLTGSKRKRKLFVSQVEQPSNSTKAIRHFYALCVLLFSTNSACCGPLHVLLTEAVLCHGGNMELVKILNRVGAIACTDTCNRLATQVVTQRLREGIKGSVTPGIFSIASVDNIDILQPSAVVSALDATRSWHGTSIQVMQPFPISGKLKDGELALTTDFAQLGLNDSPVPVQKFKRRRTLTEHPSPHTVVVRPSDINISGVDSITYDLNGRKTTISDFHLTPVETGVITKLKEVFLAMLLKHFNLGFTNDSLNLPSIPPLVHCLQKQAFETECSNVTYVDIRSEKADCKATLLKVIDNLHKIYIKERSGS